MMPRHIVKQGECLTTISAGYGFLDWRTIYGHPQNAELRRKRPDPNLLYPGDVIFIPERARKFHACATGSEHRFIVKKPRKELRLTVRTPLGEPLAHEAYTLQVETERIEGTTDGTGLLVETLPVWASSVFLTVAEYSWDLRLGTLNPIEGTPDQGTSGVQARLRNLGLYHGPVNGVLDDRTRQAICAFEVLQQLDVTGRPAGKTLAKLTEVHGC